jgi:hypothetical protein
MLADQVADQCLPLKAVADWPQGVLQKMRILRSFALPASETQLGLALAVSVVIMGLLVCALTWQSSVIVYQRDLIRVLWSWKFSS